MITKAFRVDRSDEAVVIELATGVDSLSDTAVLDEFAEFVADLKHSPKTNVVFDFRNLPYFGSMVLETLRGVWNEIKDSGGKMALCNLSDVGSEVLQVARFDNIWSLHKTRDEALQAVSGS
ncbi:MAG: hypothetical protein CMJ78_12780 [Planctomycetaceae bacterium]|nr:hypothetical protein [Planctomycetaceae bacterium]